jgi:hypothetical protein
MNTLAKVFVYLVASFLFALLNSDLAAANQKACTTAQEKQALDEADRLPDWDAVHRSFIRFAHCDDGAIAEGYSDTVGRLLERDWNHVAALAKIVAADKRFENFVLRHIDETLPTDTLDSIASNAEKSCPKDHSAFCRKILQSARFASAH